MDGNAVDPRIARVLLRYRERVAQASADAREELRLAGFTDEQANEEFVRAGVRR